MTRSSEHTPVVAESRWPIVSLKFAADVSISNVDKHALPDELAVRLCNIVDVFANEFISDEIDFMPATASREQVEKFALHDGDVLLAKDSLKPDRIAIPSLVTGSIEGLVCAYGIAILRTKPGRITSRFLLRLLQSAPVNAYFVTHADGVTIAHLSQHTLTHAPIPLPPPEEQRLIAAFLDRETDKAEALTRKYERLLELLEEKRVALITQAVTKGLDLGTPMKGSGVEWIGDIPANWGLVPFRYCGLVAEGQVDSTNPAFDDVILIAPNHIEPNTGRLISRETCRQQGAISGKYRVQQGDIVYSKIRPALNKVVIAAEDCLCSADMYPIKPTSRVRTRFLLYFMLSRPFVSLATEMSMRVAMPKINREALASVPVVVPPAEEQDELVAALDHSLGKIEVVKERVSQAVALIKEHRSALIAASVTGQLDVRVYRAKEAEVSA